MDRSLQRLCARYCGQSLILTRNEASQAVLSSLGMPSELGTDTAQDGFDVQSLAARGAQR